jgi:4-hydroxy-tetrahydrodipicolinate reductase
MKIALLGYGKMGKAIESLAGRHEIVLRIDRENAPELRPDPLREADVAIEFSRPEAAYHNIRTCLEAGIPVVSGTTGWLQRLPDIRNYLAEQGGAFLYASNFSVGVNLLFALNRVLARWMDTLPQYSVDIREVHHTEKLDAPSGTAITLAEGLIGELGSKQAWINEPTDDPALIPIISERVDQVPGTHEVTWHSSIDDLQISHVAHSREGFARGALLAAEWIRGKKGFFTMDDVLQIYPGNL